MLIEHTFDISQFLNENSQNVLQVILRSSVLEGQNKLLGTFSVGNFPSEESVFLRKPPHMFGWDIMPRLVSAGLWKDVEIQVLNPEQIRNIQYMVPLLDINSKSARLYVDMQIKMPFERFDKVKAVYTISRNGQVVNKVSSIISSPAFRQIIEMKNVDFWWPRGYGEPALYDAKVEIVDSDNNVLAQDNRRIGIRTIKLDISDINLPPDNPGRFRFIVNNEPIFIKGTNWVPMDALHSRDNSFIDESIEMAVDLNCNMIRCWGGNVYEDTHFFDLCDENGIMVWQDFTMGCTFYPQRSSFAQALETEAISVVCKLRNHPSLVLWLGNNEDDAALRWSLQPLNINPNKDNVSRKVLPAVIYEFDPTRPYLPSSPYYSEEVYQRGSGDNLLPENHLWGPRGYYKDGFYTNAECVFVSEIGYHGCPNLESLKRMMTKDCVYPWTKILNGMMNGLQNQ
jgi:Beta-galactosidase/beta-glucuronidase